MKPLLNRLTAFCLLVAMVVSGCGSAAFKQDPGRRLAMDGITLAYIGREALSEYGYEEIIRRAVDAGFLRYPTSEETNAQKFVGQTLEEAARQAWPVFTQWAVAASITSQVDSPAPGPADVVALGMIVVGLVSAGYVAAMVYTSPGVVAATPAPTTKPTTTAPPIPIGVPTTRYPNQTCKNDELDRLEAEKKKLCESGYATDCPKDPLRKREFAKIPCSLIKLSLQQRQACKAARWLIQNTCFGGKPDAAHKGAIDQVQNGINNCEALKLINCAEGHPMAGK